MKKIAIITGASSGMGKVFAETINTYDTFDEVWVIARRLDRLESLQETVPFPVRPIALDLTDRESFRHYAELLENAQANVQLLVNCSGYGKFQAACDTPLSQNLNMVDLNCEALMAMCQLTIPYMHAGAQIIRVLQGLDRFLLQIERIDVASTTHEQTIQAFNKGSQCV